MYQTAFSHFYFAPWCGALVISRFYRIIGIYSIYCKKYITEQTFVKGLSLWYDLMIVENILELKNINKAFSPEPSLKDLLSLGSRAKASTTALRDVSFGLPQGKILAVLGPNGAGKTTLLKIICGLILADSGTISVDGFKAGADDIQIKKTIGLGLDEERSFYWRLSGRQNLEFFCALYGLRGYSLNKRVSELLELFEITYADKRFDSYSTGMKRRFALARGLIHNPKIIILDEPTKSLDYPSAFHLRTFIREKLVNTEGKTVVFTTHHMDEAAGFADLYMILSSGRIIAYGELNHLREMIGRPDAGLGEVFLRLTQKNTYA